MAKARKAEGDLYFWLKTEKGLKYSKVAIPVTTPVENIQSF